MNRLNTLLWTVGLSAVCVVSQAQITYGGSPWHEGPRPGAIEFPALDLEALRAEDDVTDRYKEAPWRFGVEHDVALNAVEHGVKLILGQVLSKKVFGCTIPKGCWDALS